MWTTSYLSLKAETEDLELFPPFAKRSKEVNRYSEESALPVQQLQETFWGIDRPQPCLESMGYKPFYPSLNSPAGMISKRNEVNLSHDKLPHPSQLMRRRKRGQQLQTHAGNVLQHIGELRMKQRHINELKVDKWWGTTVSQPEESSSRQEFTFPGNEELAFPEERSLNEILMEKNVEAEKLPYRDDSFQFQSTGLEQFAELAPGANPLMAFAAGTAQRSNLLADEITLNCGGSDAILRSDDDDMLLQRFLSRV